MSAKATRSKSAAQHANAPRAPFVLLVLGLIVGGMVTLLMLNTASAANEVARHDLADSDQSAAAQMVDLQNQAQASAAPANVAAAARALGMVPAGNPGFLEINKNGSVRVMGHAVQASDIPVYVPPTATAPAHHSKPTPTATKTKSASRTAAPTRTSPNARSKKKSTAAKSAAAKSSTPSPTPTPTPTPTPNSTLPGGQR